MSNTAHVQLLPCVACVHSPKTTTSAVTGSDSEVANLSASPRTEKEQSSRGHTTEQRVRVEHVTDRQLHMMIRVDGKAADQDRKRYAPQNRRQPRSGRDPGVGPCAPTRVVDLPPPLDRDDADDHPDQNREQRQV